MPTTLSLPEEFERYTAALMGDELWTTLRQGLAEEPPVSIRMNPFKAPQVKDATVPSSPILNTEPLTDIVPWCPLGRYLSSRPAFTFDPLLHAGAYYVQEASSMFIHEVLRQVVQSPVNMLDLCAAPGGKSITCRAALPEGSLLFSNEPMKVRASILSENIRKMGHPDIIVTNNFAKDYARSGLLFDVVLTDVPCSGEGMFRKDAGAIAEWSTENVAQCWQLQRSIVSDIWPCLKPGGILIYSTCTFNAHEDEENVAWIAKELGASFVKIETREEWNITGSLIDDHPVYRFLPGKTRGEGLFVAVLRKDGEDGKNGAAVDGMLSNNEGSMTTMKAKDRKPRHGKNKVSSTGQPADKAIAEKALQWLGEGFTVVEARDGYRAIPQRWSDVYAKAAKALHIIHAGTKLGTVKGHDLIPDASLALSTALLPDAFPRVELSLKEAISYLRKEAVTLPESTPRGFVIVTYRGLPLGFEKNIGNRANNLYPQEWKIKSSHLPEGLGDVASLPQSENAVAS